MKILHLVGDRRLPADPDRASTSGVVRAALELARAQVRLGHDVSIAAIGQTARRSAWHGVQLICLPEIRWARIRARGRVLDFSQHLPYMLFTRGQEYDVVHGHLYTYLRFLQAKVRVAHFHSDPFYKGSQNEGIDLKARDFASVAQHSDAQVAVSRFIGAELESGLRGTGNVHVVHNGVDADCFDPAGQDNARLQLRREWGLSEQTVAFLFAGAIVPEKGLVQLARAFARLAADKPALHLVVAGASGLWGGASVQVNLPSDYEKQIDQILRCARDAGQVHLLGKVSGAAMPGVYAASDIVVVPSVWREPFALVALEAMASARPVIASRTGGLVEFVNEQNGILISPGEEAELQDAMLILAENPELRNKLGSAARVQAHRFSWATAAQQLDTIYGNLLATKA